jgi:hypothetical protein
MRRGCVGLLCAGIVFASLIGPASGQERGGRAIRSHSGHGGGISTPVFRGRPFGADRGPVTTGPEPPRFSTFSSGLLERNFAIMRDTSPNPRAYMGGQLNPRPEPSRRGFHRGFGGVSFGGGVYYGDGFYGGGVVYGGYPLYPLDVYGGLCYPPVYSLYGGPPFIPSQPVIIIQREVIVPRSERSRDGAFARRGEEDDDLYPRAPRREEEPRDRSLRERRSDESLSDAVADIRAAWMNGDMERFQKRVGGDRRVRIYLRGAYKYSISTADFVQMTRDAMSRMDTTSFSLDTTKLLADGRAFVAGKHAYRDAEGSKREVYVSYVLEKDDGRWRIVEAGSGTEAIARHED